MKCPLKSGRLTAENTEIFIEYTAGTLPPLDQSAFERHLNTCSECRNIASAQYEGWSALDDWTPVSMKSNFDQRLYARIAADQQTPWWKRSLDGLRSSWSWKPAMPVAAACAALLTAFLLKGPSEQHRPYAGVQPRVDIEQVERALDDIDMLQQIGVASTSIPGQPMRSEKL